MTADQRTLAGAELIAAEVRRDLIQAAWLAVNAIGGVLADPKVRTHGLAYSQMAGLQEARDALIRVLP